MDATTQTAQTRPFTITPLQGDAWAAWNASYSAPVRDAYRSVGRALYQQDLHERIAALFARSDAQNHSLDSYLSTREH